MSRRLLFAALLLAAAAGAEEPPRRVGTSACGTALCHNAVTPWTGTSVRMDEYRIWRDHDPHARAWTVLRGPLAERIAARLGLGRAGNAPACLACHADPAPSAERGPNFVLTDGVGCEACHGAAERWLTSHAHGGSHQDNLRRGMYPIAVPQARAELCLSCHLGAPGRIVTHRMYAAGHPPLAFELDTYTRTQPAHHGVRAGAPSSAQVWAVGQAAALLRWLELAQATRAAGAWPEPALFRCESCHHRPGTMEPAGAHLGLPEAGSAAFAFADDVLVLAAPDADRDHLVAAALAATSARSADMEPRLAAAHSAIRDSLATVAGWTPDDGTLRALLARITRSETPTGPLTPPQAAQVVMAAEAILDGLGDGSVRGLQPLLVDVRSPTDFSPARFREDLAALSGRSTASQPGDDAVSGVGRIAP